MKIFVTGASGYLGSSLAKRLAAMGHAVRGLVRNPDKMNAVKGLGVDPVAGDLSHGQTLAEQSRWADAVVNAADSDHLASIEVMLEALAGTGKAFLHTSGSGLVSDTANGEPSAIIHTEMTAVEPIPERQHRLVVDTFARAAALRHVRSVVICNTLIYGHGLGVARDSVQVPLLVAQAMDSGIARHVGRGLNRWSNIHIADVVTLYLAALERAPAGSFVYAEAGEAAFAEVTAAIARKLGLPAAEDWDLAAACAYWGREHAMIALGSNSRVRSLHARGNLGWQPVQRSLLQWIDAELIA